MHDTPDTKDKTRYNFVCGGRERHVSIPYNPVIRGFRDMRVARIQSPKDINLHQITRREGVVSDSRSEPVESPPTPLTT